MAADDVTLAAEPALFVRRRSLPATAALAALAVVFVIGAVFCVVFADVLRELAWQDQGRRSGFAPVVVPVAVTFFLLLGVICGLLAAVETVRWHRVGTGTAMRVTVLRLADDAAAETVHALLRTGDPAVYRPLPNVDRGPVLLRIYRADADRIAIFTLQRGTKGDVRIWPLVTFADPAYAALEPLTARDLVSSPGR